MFVIIAQINKDYMLKIMLNKLLIVVGLILVTLVLTNPSIIELQYYINSNRTININPKVKCGFHSTGFRPLGKKMNFLIFTVYSAQIHCTQMEEYITVEIIGIGKNFFLLNPEDDFKQR